ncbi:MAG: transglutaminase family protein, partial [Bacteroidota bacterium]
MLTPTKSLFQVVVFGLILVPLLLISWKLQQGYFSPQQLLPQPTYQVQYDFSLGHLEEKKELFVRAYIPQSSAHQQISNAQVSSSVFLSEQIQSDAGQQITWRANEWADSAYQLTYRFDYQGQALNYDLSPELSQLQAIPESVTPWLAPSKFIQAEDERITRLANELMLGSSNMESTLRQFYGYAEGLRPIQTSELTDAITALEAGAASCNGKSRLFVALCRAAGIPARVVGGIILQDVQKRTSHLWAEAYVHGQWVPFDPLNHHFAFLPQNYLELYRGDHFLISRSSGIDFAYQFTINKQEAYTTSKQTAYSLWTLPLSANLP